MEDFIDLNKKNKIPIKPDPDSPFLEFTPIAGEPARPEPGSWGLDPITGRWIHPQMTPAISYQKSMPVRGSLDYYDQNQYVKNTKLEAFHPFVVDSGHVWQTVFQLDGRRYMYVMGFDGYAGYDITDPLDSREISKDRGDGSYTSFGHLSVHKYRGKLIAVLGIQSPRFGVVENRWREPEKLKALMEYRMLRGFCIYEVTDPDFKKWKLLSRTSLDPYHSDPDGPQQGSGSLDTPYVTDNYLFVCGAPDDTFVNTEYRSTPYSGAQIVYDISNLTQPRLLSSWWVRGQRLGEEQDGEIINNPRYGNRTSWLGARQPLAISTPPEEGGKYGFAPMGGLGMHVIDISNPQQLKRVGKLDLPVSVGGTEGDNIDVTQVEKTGIVYFNGYPLSKDGYEPYKDIYAVDVKDPANPRVIGTLPRPTPPKEAPFTDFCQRRSAFGPKRSGKSNATGSAHGHHLFYSFYNAGLQIFDVSDPLKPTVAGYFVPKMAAVENPKYPGVFYMYPSIAIFVEWDRRLIWIASSHGMYAVSTPLLGDPILGPMP